MGLRKLIMKNDRVKCHTGEEQLSATGNGFVFGGANGAACAASLCRMATRSGTWIDIKLY